MKVQATYVGADAVAVEQGVTSVLEQQINGVENMDFITSNSSSDGVSSISVSFDSGTDGNINQVIVDLANQKMREGESVMEAAKFSAKSRLRPILMTAISSLTGFLPLMLASGAGAQSQSSLGLVVFGGLLVASFLSTLVVPVFYVVMKILIGDSKSKTGEDTSGVMSH